LLKLIRIIKYFAYKPPSYTLVVLEPKENFEVRPDWFFISLKTATLITIFLNTCLLIHIFACLWYLTARYDNFGKKCWVIANVDDPTNLYTLYVTAFYWST